MPSFMINPVKIPTTSFSKPQRQNELPALKQIVQEDCQWLMIGKADCGSTQPFLDLNTLRNCPKKSHLANNDFLRYFLIASHKTFSIIVII